MQVWTELDQRGSSNIKVVRLSWKTNSSIALERAKVVCLAEKFCR